MAMSIPGMECSPPIHAMAGPDPVWERPHTRSSSPIEPIWYCWPSAMSEARRRTSVSCVRSRTIIDISTACAWWSCMSRAKPAAALSSDGAATAPPSGHRTNMIASATASVTTSTPRTAMTPRPRGAGAAIG